MADRYSERGASGWEDEEHRSPYDTRYRERDWRYGSRDRAFFERFVEELRSWFGDEEAQRRRMADEREDMRHHDDWGARGRGRSDWESRPDWQRGSDDRDWARQWGSAEGRRASSGERSREWDRGYGSSDYPSGSSTGYGT